MDIKYLCIKDFHLPFKSTAVEINNFHEKLKQSDITGYAVGPIYTNSTKAIDDAFDYAQRVGVKLIIGIPNKEDLAYLSNKTKETGIRFAIHNHGPEDKLYPNATVIYNLIKNLDPNLGMCFDMGMIRVMDRMRSKICKAIIKEYLIYTSKMSLRQLRKGLPVNSVVES